MRCVLSWAGWFTAVVLLLAGCGEQADAVRAPANDEEKSPPPADPGGTTPNNGPGTNSPGGTAAPKDAVTRPDTENADPPDIAPLQLADPLRDLPAPRPASPARQAEIGRQLAALVDKPDLPPDLPDKLRQKLNRPPVEFEDGKIVYLQLTGAVRVTDEHLKLLEGLADLKSLSLSNVPHITNAGLVHVRGLGSLEKLSLNHNRQLGDEGVLCLRGLTSLKQLELVDVGLTDAGLAALTQLDRLERLKLQGTKITDDGLPHLRSLAGLKDLWLQSTAVSRAAAEKLKSDLPNVKFIRLNGAVLKADGS